jgi:hypothetical protein
LARAETIGFGQHIGELMELRGRKPLPALS